MAIAAGRSGSTRWHDKINEAEVAKVRESKWHCPHAPYWKRGMHHGLLNAGPRANRKGISAGSPMLTELLIEI